MNRYKQIETHVFDVRGRTYVARNQYDITYNVNEMRASFREMWINETAITLALVISGADPIAVTSDESIFFRAARDMWRFSRGPVYDYNMTIDVWSFSPVPIYGNDSITIAYYKRSNHRPLLISYYTNGNTDVLDMEMRDGVVLKR